MSTFAPRKRAFALKAHRDDSTKRKKRAKLGYCDRPLRQIICLGCNHHIWSGSPVPQKDIVDLVMMVMWRASSPLLPEAKRCVVSSVDITGNPHRIFTINSPSETALSEIKRLVCSVANHLQAGDGRSQIAISKLSAASHAGSLWSVLERSMRQISK